MKEYTNEELNALNSSSIPKLPVIELTKQGNMLTGANNLKYLVANAATWTVAPGVYGKKDYYEFVSDGSVLIKNNEANAAVRMVTDTVPVTAGNKYTISFMYKMVEGSVGTFTINLIYEDSSGNLGYDYFNSTQATIKEFFDGWYTFTVTFTALTGYIKVRPSFSSGPPATNKYYFKLPYLVEGESLDWNEIYKMIPSCDIVAESLEMNQILDSNKALTFYGINSQTMKIQCTGLNRDYRGYMISLLLYVGNYVFDVFEGEVESQNNNNHEDVITTLTCYDLFKSMKRIDFTDWYSSLNWSSINNLMNFYIAFYNELRRRRIGILPTVWGSSAMGTFNIPTKPDLVSIYGKLTGDIIVNILSCAMVNYFYFDGFMLKHIKLIDSKEGLHPSVELYPSSGLHPSGGSYDEKYKKSDYISASYEAYKTEKIDRVTIIDSNKNVVYTRSRTGTSNNVYYIEQSPLVPNSALEMWSLSVLKAVENIWFYPSKIVAPYDARIEIGDLIKIYTNKNVVYTYIIQKNVKGIQAMFATYTNKSEQYQPIPSRLK